MAFEFHVSKAARVRYDFDRALFQTSGNVIIPDFPAARAFAKVMNERVDPARYPDRVVHAAELNAMGLIDEIRHHAIEIYRRTVNPNVMADAVAQLTEQVQPERLDHALVSFVAEFPPLAVYRDGQDPPRTSRATRTAIPTARSRWRSCSCSGWRTSIRPFALSTSCSTTRTWPRRPPTRA